MTDQATARTERLDQNEAAQASEGGNAERLTVSPEAHALIDELRAEYGPVLFHLSGGCCDGSVPMCYQISDFFVSDNDIRVGEVAGAEFYMSRSEYEIWKDRRLVLDVRPGNGGAFSLENGRSKRFHLDSRLLSQAEKDAQSGACEIRPPA